MFLTLARTVRRRSRFFSIDIVRPSAGPASLEPEANATDSVKTALQQKLGLQNDSIAACHRDSNRVDSEQSLAMETVAIPHDRRICNHDTNVQKSKEQDVQVKTKGSNAFIMEAILTLEQDIVNHNVHL
ncbi:hypothetical protein SPRG_15483 [Saprolegnia parasitica CBS 223.65]|uniref:Uncharacterized protein n=1 Tax=Saprolegnia parasitica (strain CBS 223.65) TaxID=695850 RepID=A0A067BJ04_SAPPC|nr:hypothetical protein SPRG_15483 [Saprolegnia parasitica CBS 223.65]KDO18404.1 hypothetical protein SPRG_15483 [Saprolegnia parasitica CBS 223.65]|eukprot:XP_012210891.1 hypothetical protein SPRG_15483 [Saprolegnia parasitica CBS 223.65]